MLEVVQRSRVRPRIDPPTQKSWHIGSNDVNELGHHRVSKSFFQKATTVSKTFWSLLIVPENRWQAGDELAPDANHIHLHSKGYRSRDETRAPSPTRIGRSSPSKTSAGFVSADPGFSAYFSAARVLTNISPFGHGIRRHCPLPFAHTGVPEVDQTDDSRAIADGDLLVAFRIPSRMRIDFFPDGCE